MSKAMQSCPSNHLAPSDEAKLAAVASAEFLKLQSLFQSMPTPYGLDGAVRFNLLFSHLYPRLSPPERRRAEHLVDTLMENLERKDLQKAAAAEVWSDASF